MKNKFVFWFIGSTGSGKTTQSRLFHKFYNEMSDDENIYPQIKPIKNSSVNPNKPYSYFSLMSNNTANLGRWTGKPCCGTDTLSTKAQIESSLFFALMERDIVIIDGIMATGKWIDFIRAHKNIKLILIHLKIDTELNELRVRERRAAKSNLPIEEVILEVKTKENILRKIKNFSNLYRKLKDEADLALEVSASDSPESISHYILKNSIPFLLKNIK